MDWPNFLKSQKTDAQLEGPPWLRGFSPTSKVLEVQSLVGSKGCIAGGAIRDCLLGREPKDYDIFLFNTKADDLKATVEEILEEGLSLSRMRSLKGIEGPAKELGLSLKSNSIRDYGGSLSYLPVLDVDLWGLKLQFISGLAEAANIEEIVSRFPFTLSMAACNSDGEFIIPKSTQKALEQRTIIANPKFATHKGTTGWEVLKKRGEYLADKLGFAFPISEKEKLLSFYEKSRTLETDATTAEKIANKAF